MGYQEKVENEMLFMELWINQCIIITVELVKTSVISIQCIYRLVVLMSCHVGK